MRAKLWQMWALGGFDIYGGDILAESGDFRHECERNCGERGDFGLSEWQKSVIVV